MITRRRILIVDDEEQVLFVWRLALEKLANRCTVDTARNGKEALDKMERSPFDLVITDLRMPGLSGQELTHLLRNMRPDLPVVWISAYRTVDIDAEATRLKITRCLDKPLTIAQIREIVPEVLDLADRQL